MFSYLKNALFEHTVWNKILTYLSDLSVLKGNKNESQLNAIIFFL